MRAGRDLTCGINQLDEILCWGRNPGFQLDGSFVDLILTSDLYGISAEGLVTCAGDLQPPPSEFISANLGNGYGCGLRKNGSIQCWGSNEHNQTEAPDGTFISLSVGNSYSCAVRTEGEALCWGRELDGRTKVENDVVPLP